jgi:2'-5' RNA ligase
VDRERDKSALVVLVPEVESLVGEFRREFDISCIHGLGAHVTILFPFRTPDSLSVEVVAELRKLFAAQQRFRFSLTSVGGFPSVVFLVPSPRDPFDSLTRVTTIRFPDCPPYGGAFPHPVPHLTVAQQPPAEDIAEVADRIRARVERFLPLSCSVADVSLAIKSAGRWSIAERFGLG